jgi:ABC-2 type transport system permease protein
MTTAVAPPAPTAQRVTTARVCHSEWTKFWSIRSPRWTLLIAVVLMVGLSALLSALAGHSYHSMSAGDRATFDPVGTSLSGAFFAQLAIGVLGALVITGEYGTGMIRSSLTAVPKRLPVLWTKMAVTGLVSFLIMFVAGLVSFLLGQALLSSYDLDVSISSPDAFRSILGVGLAAALIAVFALAVGALLRNTAAAISTFVGVFFVLPPLASLLPGSIGDRLSAYLPSNAANDLIGTQTDAHALSPWGGFAMLCLYTAVLACAAAVQLRQRDV